MRTFDVDEIFLNFPSRHKPPSLILSSNSIMVSKRVKRKAATSGSATASSKAKGKAKASVMDPQRRPKPALNGSTRRSQRRSTAVASASSSKFRDHEGDSSETDSQSEECHDPTYCNCRSCSNIRYTWTVVAADIENQGLTPDDSVRLWSICPSEALWNRCMRLSQELRLCRFQSGMSETEIGIVTKLAFGFQEAQRH